MGHTRIFHTFSLLLRSHEKVAGGRVSAGTRASGALSFSLVVLGTHIMSARVRQGRLQACEN